MESIMITSIQASPIINKTGVVGHTLQLLVTTLPESEKVTLTFSSDKTAVCSVTNAGVATFKAIGDAIIKVTDTISGKYDYFNVSVVADDKYSTVAPEINENMAKGYIKIIQSL